MSEELTIDLNTVKDAPSGYAKRLCSRTPFIRNKGVSGYNWLNRPKREHVASVVEQEYEEEVD